MSMLLNLRRVMRWHPHPSTTIGTAGERCPQACAGYSRGTAAALGAATGLIEPLGALLGAAALGASASLLPWGLAFAAGAMLFVVSHEIIPESHSRGHEAQATMGLIAGFAAVVETVATPST